MNNYTAIDCGAAGAATIMKKYSPETLPPSDRFHYHQGVFLTGLWELYSVTGDTKYFDYIKAWVDFNVKEDGSVPSAHLDEFDDMQPAVLLINLYDATGDERYKTALDAIIEAARRSPKNAAGGFWHKRHLKNQMWLDCMYMMGLLLTKYALRFDEPYLIEVVSRQMELMYEHMRDPKTGLLYHAWDISRAARWADPVTGCSPAHWGRAMGWFTVAAAEIACLLPKTHSYRPRAAEIAVKTAAAAARYQDETTGLWYQVTDKGADKRNWFETSCSALFVYAMARLRGNDIVDDCFDDNIRKGYEGVISRTKTENGLLTLDGVCIGTGVGDESFYFSRPTVSTDLHGMGAFVLMCAQLGKNELQKRCR